MLVTKEDLAGPELSDQIVIVLVRIEIFKMSYYIRFIRLDLFCSLWIFVMLAFYLGPSSF